MCLDSGVGALLAPSGKLHSLPERNHMRVAVVSSLSKPRRGGGCALLTTQPSCLTNLPDPFSCFPSRTNGKGPECFFLPTLHHTGALSGFLGVGIPQHNTHPQHTCAQGTCTCVHTGRAVGRTIDKSSALIEKQRRGDHGLARSEQDTDQKSWF